jgi:predicted metal-binding membrane protein
MTQGSSGSASAPVSAATRLDRISLWAGLAAITALAWWYLIRMPATDVGMAAMGMPMKTSGLADTALTFLMWAVMMVAMMLPTVSPVVLMYAAIARGEGRSPGLRVWCFVAGYLAAWTMFSVGATLVQELLRRTSMINEAFQSTPGLSAGLLIGAGLYQLSPIKNACLSSCRSPFSFFMTNWRAGARGAFLMGLTHGGYCIGCCWLLMALLFVAGVMNLLWIAALGALVLLEKVSRFGPRIVTVAGVAMIAFGAWLLVGLPRLF